VNEAHPGRGCIVVRNCGVGTGAELGPGVAVLDRTRLPGKAMPATVGAGAKVGGGAVIAGVKVGEGAYVAAGEPKRSVRTSRGTWRTMFPMRLCGWEDGCQRGSTGRRGIEASLSWQGRRAFARRPRSGTGGPSPFDCIARLFCLPSSAYIYQLIRVGIPGPHNPKALRSPTI
jgi:hypothetical protein